MRIALLALFLTACVTHSEVYEQRWEQRRDYWLSQMYSLKCDEGEDKAENNCGIIIGDLYRNASTFARDICHIDISHQPMGQDCSSKFASMATAKLALRYPQADWGQTGLWCDAHPATCGFQDAGHAETFEAQLMLTHNQAIHDLAMHDRDNIQNEADQDATRRRRAFQQSLSHMGDGLIQNQPVNCTSNTYGGTMYTNCQ